MAGRFERPRPPTKQAAIIPPSVAAFGVAGVLLLGALLVSTLVRVPGRAAPQVVSRAVAAAAPVRLESATVSAPAGIVGGACAQEGSGDAVYQAAVRFTVVITTASGQGSGILVGPSTLATNAHVVGSSKRVTVRFADGSETVAAVAWKDTNLDLALVQLDAPASSSFRVATLASSTTISPGRTVYALGAPIGLRWTFTRGVVSAIRNDGSEVPAIQTDVAVSPGNSGGPLIDGCGRVVGIVTSKVVLAEAEGLAFARPIEMLPLGAGQ